jgi:hypothetical protein
MEAKFNQICAAQWNEESWISGGFRLNFFGCDLIVFINTYYRESQKLKNNSPEYGS